MEDKWKERLQSFATISLHASIVQWNSQETLESDFLSSKHGRGSYNNCGSPDVARLYIYMYVCMYVCMYNVYISLYVLSYLVFNMAPWKQNYDSDGLPCIYILK